METIVTKQMAIQWLKNNGYYDAFVENVGKFHEHTEFPESLDDAYSTALESKCGHNIIACAFPWIATKEGTLYWKKVSDEYESWCASFSTEAQCQLILAHLKEGYTITALEAIERFGCLRVQSRIFDLRKRGWNIKTTIVKTKSGKRIAEYSLEEEDK